jgi:hypothetical protein
MDQIEKYFHHLPECDCLMNTTCKVPCSCGRDKALAEIHKIHTEYFTILQAFANLHLTVLYIGPMA